MKYPKSVVHLVEYKAVRKVLTHLGNKTNSENTKLTYLYGIRRFCEFMDMNPDRLIAERKKHLKSDDVSVRRQHEERLMECFNKYDATHSRSHARGTIVAVMCLYRTNYVDLHMVAPKNYVEHTDRIPTLEELRQMVDATSGPLMRAIIIFSAQSGQRVGIVASMRYGMVRKGLESGECPLRVDVPPGLTLPNGKRANKNRARYSFFIGRDAVDALNTYLEVRRVRGDRLTDDAFLFTSEKQFRGTYVPLDGDAINRLVRRAAINAGLIEEVKNSSRRKRYGIHHHCMRKFWQTAMEQAGVARSWFDYMMGHTLSALDRAYSHPTSENLLEAYGRAEKYVSVSRYLPDAEKLKYETLLEATRLQAKALGLDPMRITIEREAAVGTKLPIEEEVALLQDAVFSKIKARDEALATAKGPKRYEHKTVSENVLVKHLNDGWDYMEKLGNGTVLVRKLVVA